MIGETAVRWLAAISATVAVLIVFVFGWQTAANVDTTPAPPSTIPALAPVGPSDGQDGAQGAVDRPGRPDPVASVALRVRPERIGPPGPIGESVVGPPGPTGGSGPRARPLYPDRPANQSKDRPATPARKENVASPVRQGWCAYPGSPRRH